MKKRSIYLFAFLIPLVTMVIGMIYLKVTPFGDNSFLIIDSLHQYMPFYSVLYDKLKSGGSLLYSFRTGLGINFLSLFAYYLSSPLNLFILFFKKTQLNMAVGFIIVFKLALSSLFASIYFYNKSQKKEKSLNDAFVILAVSTAYALNGYMVGYCWNVMWLDAIMILPMVMMGIERLIDKNDGRLYAISLFYALYGNYYIAFMICIFSVIWYLFYSFRSIKQFFFRGIVFTFYSFLAAGMSAVLLLPAYFGIKQTASGNEMMLPEHSFITNFWDLIVRQYNMAYPITNDNFDGNVNLYFGIFTIFFLLLYMFNKKISLISKIKRVILVVFFYLSFNEQILNFIWHGFHDQYGIPNRFSFLYGFVLLVMTFEVLEKRDAIRIWEPFVAMLGSAAIVLASAKFSSETPDRFVGYATLSLLIVYGMLVILIQMSDRYKTIFTMLLTFVMLGEICLCSLIGFDSNGQISISKFFSNTKDMEKAIHDMDDGTFYRSEMAAGKIVDESTWYPMNAITLFGSTALDSTVEIMDSLGFYTGCNEYLYEGPCPVTNLMLGVKYQYFHKADNMKTEFKYKATYGNIDVYENPVTGLSLGYGINENIDEWNSTSAYPFRVLNDFADKGYGIQKIFKNIPIEDFQTQGCTVENTDDSEYYFEFKESLDDNIEYIFFPEKEMHNLYIFYDGTQVENAKINLDDKVVKSGDLDGQMVRIGHVPADTVVIVSFKLKGEIDDGYLRLTAAELDQQKFEQLTKAMTDRAFHITDKSDSHIEGTIEATTEQKIFFSIPYDKGWKVSIDGKSAETGKIGNAFLSVIIPKGKHKIVLDYIPSGYLLGRKISIGCTIVFLIICVISSVLRRTGLAKKKEHKEVIEHEKDVNCSDDDGGDARDL